MVKAVSEQARAVRPGIKISAAVFPNWVNERDNIGQDWKLWCEKGYLDFVCPMDYSASNNNFNNLIKKQLDWAGKTPCYPGIGASTAQFGADNIIEQINITRRLNTRGFIIFNYGVPESREILPHARPGHHLNCESPIAANWHPPGSWPSNQVSPRPDQHPACKRQIL